MNEKGTNFVKKNWEQTKQHFIDWWNHKGLVVGCAEPGVHIKNSTQQVINHGEIISPSQRYTDADWRVGYNHYELYRRSFPLDILPFSDTHIGPGSMCLYLGCEPEFAEDTVWYHPCINESNHDSLLVFDQQQSWWQIQQQIIKKCIDVSEGNYFVGIPDLVEGLDVLVSMCGVEKLIISLLDEPHWVKKKLAEIEMAYFEVYQRIYDMVHMENEGCVYGAFSLWSPGRVGKLQCDMATMISPVMFREFTVPYLKKQCGWLDHSMFHLDGTQCIVHLDALLEIEHLDAIEWTPQASLPCGADKQWHDMYKRILSAGKSVQIIGVKPDEIIPLIDTVGTKGVYILAQFDNEAECERIAKQLESFKRL